jgi:enoyl-CoA hydratase
MNPEQMNPARTIASDQPPVSAYTVAGREFRTLKLTQDGLVLIITIDHPDNKFNLMDQALHEDLAALVSDLRTQRDARAIVLTANGKYFSGGGSFDLMGQMNSADFARYIAQLAKQTIYDMLQVPVPIVCAMNGPAIGFGASPVLLSDVVFAGEDISLSDPHALRGVVSADGPALWSLALGPVRAKRFLLTGEKLSATEAAELGLITFVTAPGEALGQAVEFAKTLAAGPPSAIAHTKLLCNIYIRDALDMSFDTGAAWSFQDFLTNDHQEAISAFRERRTPKYSGT